MPVNPSIFFRKLYFQKFTFSVLVISVNASRISAELGKLNKLSNFSTPGNDSFLHDCNVKPINKIAAAIAV